MVYYPASVASFTTHADYTEVIVAAHPNLIQDEVVATQTIIGTDPNVSTTPSSSGSFNASSTAFATLKARLANIETGIVADSHTQYVKNVGGSTIVSSSASVKGLVVKGASSQTANLQEWQDSSGNVLAKIDATGALTDAKVSGDLDALYVTAYVFG